MENEKIRWKQGVNTDDGSASNTAVETKGSKAKENDNMTAEEKGSKAKADNLTTEAKGGNAKADNLTTEAKGGKAREANFTAETRNDETEAQETRDRSEAETREGTIQITMEKTTMITEQGGSLSISTGKGDTTERDQDDCRSDNRGRDSDKHDRTRDKRSMGELQRMHQFEKATPQR